MDIKNHISLKPYNTFGIDVKAKDFVSVQSVKQLRDVLIDNKSKNKLILGGGSNLLLTKDQDLLVIHVDIKGIEIIEENEDFVLIKASAGENWHEFVIHCINNDFGGIENLSLIPGNVGTAPIQNIGAYGVEIKDSFISCEALSTQNGKISIFSKEDCQFDYRNSIFKQQAKGKYVINSVTFRLSKRNHQLHINYGAIKSQLEIMNVVQPTIKDISNAVIKIRQSKLPDPKKIGNSGSFFKNPLISKYQYKELLKNFPDMPFYPISENHVKVPAGWLVEKAGFKGKRFDDYGVHKDQALVLVNYGKASGKDILKLAQLIQHTIHRLFGILIEPEVNIL